MIDRKKKDIINTLVPISIFYKTRVGKNIRCPDVSAHKHGDKSPSAHIYENKIFCFKCRRYFNVSDIAVYNHISLDKLYEKLVEKYGSNLEIEYLKRREEPEEEIKIEVKKENKSFIDFTKEYFNSL